MFWVILLHLMKYFQGRDLSPVTDRLWKRFYVQQFGEDNANLVIKRMKQRDVVFKWRQLFEVLVHCWTTIIIYLFIFGYVSSLSFRLLDLRLAWTCVLLFFSCWFLCRQRRRRGKKPNRNWARNSSNDMRKSKLVSSFWSYSAHGYSWLTLYMFHLLKHIVIWS